MVCDQRTGENEKFISLSVINTGNRKVIVDAWGIKFKNQEAIVVYMPDDTNKFEAMLYKKMPIVLEIEESVELTWSMTKFIKFLKIYENEVEDNKPITFYVRDTTGVRHCTKTKKTAGEIKRDNTN